MAAAYDISGSLLEACSCGAPCPCWIGEDPHGGKCDAFLAYRIDKGSISGVDVSGVAFAIVALVPGNILKGNWKIAVYVSDKASPGASRRGSGAQERRARQISPGSSEARHETVSDRIAHGRRPRIVVVIKSYGGALRLQPKSLVPSSSLREVALRT